MPLFFGDEAYWVTPEASNGQKTSPIFLFDGFISSSKLRSDLDFLPDVYAPSITCLMQAISECAKTYDGISANYMIGSWDKKELYPDSPNRKRSILSPIYEKHGLVGMCSGLWW